MNVKMQKLLQARIEAFATDVTNILQSAVADAVTEALPKGTRRGSAQLGKKAGRGRGARRAGKAVSPEVLLKEIAREPDRRMEQISASLGTTSKALVPTVKQLIADKKVKTTGKARGTTYRAA